MEIIIPGVTTQTVEIFLTLILRWNNFKKFLIVIYSLYTCYGIVNIRVTSKLYDFINNDDRNTVVAHKLWLGE